MPFFLQDCASKVRKIVAIIHARAICSPTTNQSTTRSFLPPRFCSAIEGFVRSRFKSHSTSHIDVADVLNMELEHSEFLKPGITFTSRLSVMVVPSGKAPLPPALLASSLISCLGRFRRIVARK